MTPPSPNSTPAGGEDEPPISEQIEKLFNLQINNTGDWIAIKFGKRRVWIHYDTFLELRESIESLIAKQNQQAMQKALEGLLEQKQDRQRLYGLETEVKEQGAA